MQALLLFPTLAGIEARTWIKTSGLDLAPWQVECTDAKHAYEFTERSLGMARMGIEPTCRSDQKCGLASSECRTWMKASGVEFEVSKVESAEAKRALLITNLSKGVV